ncbi:hypothetical protein ABPG77_009338 [Micractinium sp. CCAP 211/92]
MKRSSEEFGDEPSGAAGESSSPTVRRRSGGRRPATSVHCQVPGCEEELINAESFYRRYRVCKQHSKAAAVQLPAGPARFCQQCARFHAVSEFEEQRRSCRAALERHRSKRRTSGTRRPKGEAGGRRRSTSEGGEEGPAWAAAEQQQQQQQQQQPGRLAPPRLEGGWGGGPQHSAPLSSSGATLGRPSSSNDCGTASSTVSEAASQPSQTETAVTAGPMAFGVQHAQLEVTGSAGWLSIRGSSTLFPAIPGAAPPALPRMAHTSLTAIHPSGPPQQLLPGALHPQEGRQPGLEPSGPPSLLNHGLGPAGNMASALMEHDSPDQWWLQARPLPPPPPLPRAPALSSSGSLGGSLQRSGSDWGTSRPTSMQAEQPLDGSLATWGGHGPVPPQPPTDPLRRPSGIVRPNAPAQQPMETEGDFEVPGCGEELIAADAFYKRYRVCKRHSADAIVQLATGPARFCQQCARFHGISEFDDQRRSCRTALAKHRKKRRSSGRRPPKWKQDASATGEGAPVLAAAAAEEEEEQQQEEEKQQGRQRQLEQQEPQPSCQKWRQAAGHLGLTRSGRPAQQPSHQQHSVLAGSSGGAADWPSSSEGIASSDSGSSPWQSGKNASSEAGRQHTLEPAACAPAAPAQQLPTACLAAQQLEVSGSASLQGYGSSTLESAVAAAAAAAAAAATVPSCRMPMPSAQVEMATGGPPPLALQHRSLAPVAPPATAQRAPSSAAAAAQPLAAAAQEAWGHEMSGSLQGAGSSERGAARVSPGAQAQAPWLALDQLQCGALLARSSAGWAASSGRAATHSKPDQMHLADSAQLQFPPAAAPSMPAGVPGPQQPGLQQPGPERSSTVLPHSLLPSCELLGGPVECAGFWQWQQKPQAFPPPPLPPHPPLAKQSLESEAGIEGWLAGVLGL